MNNENLNATLRCVTRPSAAQEEKIKTFLKNKYQAHNITLNILIDPSVRGGFILSANNDEYDWSTRSRQQQLQEQIQAARDKAIQMKKDGTLMSILKEAIEQFEATSQENEVGYVETIGDGIATISGLDHAMYGEVVVFENGTKGMVLDITTENIGVILFDTEGTIGQGTKVSRTKKQAGMPVSSNFLGRVVDPLGNPIDGLGPIEATEMRPIEEPAPSIINRKPVTNPMETGILSIDSMFPIGRGQRELIIGDRQTGKTSIALDTILNQEGSENLALDLQDIRLMLEPETCAIVARGATPEQIDQMQAYCDEVTHLIEAEEDYSAADAKFHRYLAECSGNHVLPNLIPIIASAIGVVITVTNDEHRSQSGMEHQRIVDAIRRHDPEGAKYSMIAHLNTSRNSMVHSRDNCAAKR